MNGMNRNMLARRPMKLQWVAVVLGLLALVLLAAPAHAAEFRGGEETVRIGANETIDGDLFVGGTTIIIEGTVNGDVFAAGTTITIRGTVNGSVTAAGTRIEIEGPIERGVRVAGQEVVIAAAVGRDLIVLGQTVEVTDAGSVGGDVLFGASEITLAGDVGRRVLGAADTLQLAAAVGEGVDVEVNSLVVEPSARITGDLKYRSANEAEAAAGVVAGQMLREAPRADFSVDAGAATLDTVRGSVARIGVLALLGLLLLAAGRGWMERATTQMMQRPWASLLTGRFSATGFLALLIGLIVLAVLGAIPYVGWVVTGLATALGLGGALLAGRGAAQPAGSS